MSSFNKMLPDDYYNINIVKEFNDTKNPDTNYDVEIYKRNPRINYKLSLNHLEFIEYFVRLLKPKSFLELGVQFGECTNRIIDLIPRKYYAVDITSNENIDYLKANKGNFDFHLCSTDDFFIKARNMFLDLDMVFIDACHSHAASYKDFLNVKRHVNNDGIIFFHDTYPFSIKDTDSGLCGDCYKTSELIRKRHSDEFEILTLPIFPGMSIARKTNKQLAWL